MPKRRTTLDPELAAEAKSFVALAFRNGPIEDMHAGKECPVCAGKSEYSHITQAEMKAVMKQAVDIVYKLLWLRQNDPEKYEATLELGSHYTRAWDEPRVDIASREVRDGEGRRTVTHPGASEETEKKQDKLK